MQNLEWEADRPSSKAPEDQSQSLPERALAKPPGTGIAVDYNVKQKELLKSHNDDGGTE
jgi:hypothetical protein